jgi:GR25 family glycosyltransferase involved in LPS biosynthesis
MNISNYEIVDAVPSDSDEVKQKFNTGFVKKPPCFRCNLTTCNHANKVLQERQIGNWCSFINLMKKIVDENIHGLIMICEDDIKFMDNYHTIINKLVSKDFFDKYTINLNKPILIRLGNSFASDLEPSMNSPILIKKTTMSNPCFLINCMFAESFIANLKEINTTSDMFIHINLVQTDKSIQDFTLIPQIAHELSHGKYSIFKSEIRI